MTIEYEGHAAELNTKPITASALVGLLTPVLETVNMVNAPVVARERGIEVTEIKHAEVWRLSDAHQADGDDGEPHTLVCGTLFGADKPRIVRSRTSAIEAELGKHMLFVRNKDKPGFIGRLGSMLGSAGINIATFHLGRTKAGGDAIALIQVDQRIPGELLDELCTVPDVVQAKALNF